MKLIDASQIENKFLHWLNEISKDITNDIYQGSESDGIVACLEEIRGAPTVDPESLRPHGKWVDSSFYHDRPLCYDCSNCGFKLMYKPNYCPNCGAKMN